MMENIITILSVVKKQDYENTLQVFKKIIEKYYNSKMDEVLKIGTPAQIPNQHMFALTIPKEDAINIVKELTYAEVSVVKNESFIKIAVAEATNERQSEQTNTMQRFQKEETLKQKLRKRGDYTVDELVYLKDWQLMLEVALNQTYNNIEKSRRIKELLPEVLSEAIETETQRDLNNLDIARDSIDKLLLIAENETLKRFHLLGILKKAGEVIVETCRMHPKELIDQLIFLANSRTTVPSVNVKAFLAFYKVISTDIQNYENEILEATRYLNTRALNTVYIASVRLAPDEKKIFDSGIEFFKKRRDAL
jgi:hypothetical protein